MVNRNLFNLLLISNIPFGTHAPTSIPAAWGSVFCTVEKYQKPGSLSQKLKLEWRGKKGIFLLISMCVCMHAEPRILNKNTYFKFLTNSQGISMLLACRPDFG